MSASLARGLRADGPDGDWSTSAVVARLGVRAPRLLDAHHVPGAAIALLRDGRVAWASGFGLRSTGDPEPVDAHTVFEGASLTKPVFAYAVLKLCEHGTLDLDRPLGAYLGRRYLDDPRVDLITARHVLAHQTGFPNWRRGRPLSIRFTPGSRYEYSGEGFVYLQEVVEKLTSQPLPLLMRTRVLEPLGMRDSSFGWEPRLERNAASAHDKEGKPVPPLDERLASSRRPGVEEPELATPVRHAASGLYTSVADFATFMSEVLRPSGRGRHRLSKAWVAAMLVPQVTVSPGLARGLGWGLQTGDAPAMYHDGNNLFVRHLAIARLDSGNGVVCMTNGQNGHRVFEHVVPMAVEGPDPAVAAAVG